MDLVEIRSQRVVTQKRTRAIMLRLNFGYQHRIAVLASTFAYGMSVLAGVVSRGERHLS